MPELMNKIRTYTTQLIKEMILKVYHDPWDDADMVFEALLAVAEERMGEEAFTEYVNALYEDHLL